MNKILKTIALSAAVILSAAACSEWTEQQPVEFNYLTIEEKNPELYEAYMQSIRDYHATDHQVLIAKFDNKAGATTGGADSIISPVSLLVVQTISHVFRTVLTM